MKQYLELLKDIKENGVKKSDRTGTGTISVFSREIRHKMSDGFPLLTTKKMAMKQIITELLWFLNGDTNLKYLIDNNCHIWDGDAYKNYVKLNQFNSNPKWLKPVLLENGFNGAELYTQEEFIDNIKTDVEFSEKWGELGPTYGKQWRNWDKYEHIKTFGSSDYQVKNNTIDQIQNLIHLLKTNPDSRRLLVSAWNVADVDKVILPPCHYGFQCYTVEMNKAERYHKWLDYQKIHHLEDTGMSAEGAMQHYNFPTRKLSLKFNMRSTDVPLGLPFNIASYALLLEMLSLECNMISEELIVSLGDAHIYLNQIDGIDEQLTREPYESPKLVINKRNSINEYQIDDFKIVDYKYHQTIKMPLSN